MKTTTVETSQLIGDALDWAVAKALGGERRPHRFAANEYAKEHLAWVFPDGYACTGWSPSTDWSQGGPLIEKYRVWIASTCTRGSEWDATVTARTFVDAVGPTPLIAACRAIVAAELGDDVEVPAELVEASDLCHQNKGGEV